MASSHTEQCFSVTYNAAKKLQFTPVPVSPSDLWNCSKSKVYSRTDATCDFSDKAPFKLYIQHCSVQKIQRIQLFAIGLWLLSNVQKEFSVGTKELKEFAKTWIESSLKIQKQTSFCCSSSCPASANTVLHSCHCLKPSRLHSLPP